MHSSLKQDVSSLTLGLVAATALLTAIVVGTGVFLWQQSRADQKVSQLESEISVLRTQLGTSSTPGSGSSGGVACPDDARQCPDGTLVSRTGPNCAFAPCRGEKGEPGGICNSDKDCPSGMVCATAGPIRIDGPNNSRCYPKGAPIPL